MKHYYAHTASFLTIRVAMAQATDLKGAAEIGEAAAVHVSVGEVQVAQPIQAGEPCQAGIERQAVAAVRPRQRQARQRCQARDAAHCYIDCA